MRYEGPIYRPPSEADSLLIQATIGCPHNKCTFCMIYKKGPPFRIRPLKEICEDIESARRAYGRRVRTLFLPAGNTIAMPTEDLAAVCRHARGQFPFMERITVYGSSRFIAMKTPHELSVLKESGLTRIHVGLESGDDEVLRRVKKGTTRSEQIRAGRFVKDSGMTLSEYVILGLGGVERTREHALATAEALNAINPDFVRLRTLVPKTDTLLLHQMRRGLFQVLSPLHVLEETGLLIENLECHTQLTSDHYSNYLNLEGRLPEEKPRLLAEIRRAMTWDESRFRPFFIGNQ
ncbi:MAG: radical SAM protein [Desulfatiglandales bacterium]